MLLSVLHPYSFPATSISHYYIKCYMPTRHLPSTRSKSHCSAQRKPARLSSLILHRGLKRTRIYPYPAHARTVSSLEWLKNYYPQTGFRIPPAKKGHASSELGLLYKIAHAAANRSLLPPVFPLSALIPFVLSSGMLPKQFGRTWQTPFPPPSLIRPRPAVYTHPLNGDETNARGNSGILRQVPDDRGTARRNNSMKLPNCNAAELSWTGGSRRRFPKTPRTAVHTSVALPARRVAQNKAAISLALAGDIFNHYTCIHAQPAESNNVSFERTSSKIRS